MNFKFLHKQNYFCTCRGDEVEVYHLLTGYGAMLGLIDVQASIGFIFLASTSSSNNRGHELESRVEPDRLHCVRETK